MLIIYQYLLPLVLSYQWVDVSHFDSFQKNIYRSLGLVKTSLKNWPCVISCPVRGVGKYGMYGHWLSGKSPPPHVDLSELKYFKNDILGYWPDCISIKDFYLLWTFDRETLSTPSRKFSLFIIYLYLPTSLTCLAFTNGPGDLGSIPGRIIPKTLKMVLDTSLLNTPRYKVCIKWFTLMDPHTWPCKSRTTSTNIHSATMWGYRMLSRRPAWGDER